MNTKELISCTTNKITFNCVTLISDEKYIEFTLKMTDEKNVSLTLPGSLFNRTKNINDRNICNKVY